MDQPAKETGRIAKSGGKVGIAVTCSRVLGLVREQVFAYFFGAGDAYDAFVVAFRIPNLLRDLFGEGALSAAFVTVFSDYEENRGERDTLMLAGNVMVFFTILLSIITLLGIWQAENIVQLMVQAKFEADLDKVELTRLMSVIMFPFLILVSLSSVCMGILNTRGHFFVPSVSSGFFNMGSIIGGVSLYYIMPRYGYHPIVGMSIGTLTGGFLQLIGQFPSLRKAGFKFIPNLNLRNPGLQRILVLMIPAVVGLSALQLNILINTFFASSLQVGSISWLNYAFRLFLFPVGVFGVAISIAAHPVMARMAATGSFDNLKQTYVSTLTISFCLTIPAMAGLIILAEPIIRLIFQHGHFDNFDTAMTAEALAFFAIGLASYSAVKVTVPVFYNIKNTKYPVIGSFMTVAVNICVILTTINFLQHRALALSISIAMTANFLFLFTVLYWKLAGFSLIYLLKGLSKIVAGALVMIGWLFIIDTLFEVRVASGYLITDLGKLIVCILTGALVYGVVLNLLKLPEMELITAKLKERFSTSES